MAKKCRDRDIGSRVPRKIPTEIYLHLRKAKLTLIEFSLRLLRLRASALPKREINRFDRLKAARTSVRVLGDWSTQDSDHITESTRIVHYSFVNCRVSSSAASLIFAKACW